MNNSPEKIAALRKVLVPLTEAISLYEVALEQWPEFYRSGLRELYVRPLEIVRDEALKEIEFLSGTPA